MVLPILPLFNTHRPVLGLQILSERFNLSLHRFDRLGLQTRRRGVRDLFRDLAFLFHLPVLRLHTLPDRFKAGLHDLLLRDFFLFRFLFGVRDLFRGDLGRGEQISLSSFFSNVS